MKTTRWEARCKTNVGYKTAQFDSVDAAAKWMRDQIAKFGYVSCVLAPVEA